MGIFKQIRELFIILSTRNKYRVIDNSGEEIDINPKKEFIRYSAFGFIWYPIAIGLFISISDWEENGERYTFNAVTRILYELAGKWGVLLGMIMIGNIFLYIAYKKYIVHKKFTDNNPNVYYNVANATLEIAIKHELNFNIVEAKRLYEHIIQEFGASDAAKKAKLHLQGINKYS